MPYRVHAREQPEEAQKPPSDVLARIDASGRAGMGGAPGRRGAEGDGSGDDGGPGEDAGPAEPGQNGGHIYAFLEPDLDGRVRITGSLVDPDANDRRLDQTCEIGDTGHIDFYAAGGDGGPGGQGGRGGDGATGRRGSDATRYSSGGNGGPGGDGGRGGNGTSGARGGRGGKIVLEVKDEDTHLLLLTRHLQSGGQGGAAGANGRGGSGGSGGRGGSSYHWTETEHYTDSQGHSQTRTTSHSNSGGSDGHDGRDGMPGNADLHPGKPGKDGTFTIRVASREGVSEYPSCFDLHLVSFEHRSANDDGIYEPEEKVHVSRIEVENVGGMPTPRTREIRLLLRDKDWIAADAGHLVLPASLQPGQRHVFEREVLTLTLGAYHPKLPSDALTEEQVIRHSAFVPDANREVPSYENQQSFEMGRFTVQFPVRVSPLQSLHSLAPGSAARVRFRITNVSERAFGARSELRRAIAYRLFLRDSELGDDELLFFDAEGRRAPLAAGFRGVVDELGPGASVDIEGTLAVSESAPHYKAGRVWLSLELGAIDEPAKVRPIQIRAFETRVARPFTSAQPKDVLLVVNNRTTSDELAAWERLIATLGLTADVLDLSLEGRVDLEATPGGGAPIVERLAGRTLVVLNNGIDAPDGERWPAHHLSKEQLLDLAASGGHATVIGRALDVQHLAIPTTAVASGATLSEKASPGSLAKGEKPDPLIADPPEIVEVSKWTVLGFGHPSEHALVERARALALSLASADPTRRHVLVCKLDPQKQKDYFVAAKWTMGTIEVHRTLDSADAALSSVGVKDEVLHDPEAVLGRANVMSVLLALPFEEKLRRFEHLTARAGTENPSADDDGPEDAPLTWDVLARMAADAILVDLANEQLAVLHRGFCAGATPKTLRAALPKLRRLAAKLRASDGAEGLADPRSVHLVRLMARIRFFAASQVKWWEYVPPLLFERRAPVLRGVTLRLVAEMAERVLIGPDMKSPQGRERKKGVRKAIASAQDSLDRRYALALESHDHKGPKAAFARDLLLRPIEREGVTTDAEVLRRPADRVLTVEEHAAIRAKDVKRAGRRRTLMATNDQARAELMRPETAAQLLARAAQVRIAVAADDSLVAETEAAEIEAVQARAPGRPW